MLKEAREMIVDFSQRVGLTAKQATLEELVAKPERFKGRKLEVTGMGEVVDHQVKKERIPYASGSDSGWGPVIVGGGDEYTVTLTYQLMSEVVPPVLLRVRERQIYFGVDAPMKVDQKRETPPGIFRVQGYLKQDREGGRYLDSTRVDPLARD